MRRTLWYRVFEIVRPFRLRLTISFTTLLVLTAIGLYTPVWSARLIGTALVELDRDLFLRCVVMLLALHIGGSGFSYLYGYQMRILGARLIFDLRRRMYDHLQRLSLSFYESRSSGEIISRMMNDANSVTTLVTGTALNTIVSTVKAIALIGVLYVTSPMVTFLALAILPLHFLGVFFFNARLSHVHWQSSEKMSQIYGKVSEVVSAIKMVKSHSGERREGRTMVSQLREKFDIEIHAGNLSSIWSNVTGNISYVGQVLVMLVCGNAVLGRELKLEEYILLLSYVGMLYAPVSELINVVQQILPAKVGIRRVFEILDMDPEVKDHEGGLASVIRGEVEFRNVSFAYDQGDQVLKNVSFTAQPGEVVALVGPSGSGKTTIANLIARFYDRTSGTILIDGHDIQDYTQHTLREQMSMVLQETYLFRGTIADNICYGKPDATIQEVEEAARQACAHEFISAQPLGYRSPIGTAGTRLSGGQRQRLAIARALVRDPRILILDEATSSLDSVSESKVQDALNHLMKDRTTFVIAHRLSTIQSADRIIVLNEGAVMQVGRHEELIEIEGMYRELYDPEWAKRRELEIQEQIELLLAEIV